MNHDLQHMNMYEFHKNDPKQKNTDQTTSSKIDYDEYIEIITY